MPERFKEVPLGLIEVLVTKDRTQIGRVVGLDDVSITISCPQSASGQDYGLPYPKKT